MGATAIVLAVVLAAALGVRRRLAGADETGASYVVAVLLMTAFVLALAWAARDTLFDAGDKADQKVRDEISRNE